MNFRKIDRVTQVPAADAKSPAESAAPGWRVIHACENARDVLPVAEGQVAAGMRPYIVTPHGAGAAELFLGGKEPGQQRPLSLLRSWQDVRNWRQSILDCDPEASADLVHTHSFAAGMAAVRSCGCAVYDFRDCIDELALASGQCEPGSWMGRSFRAAEQFILSRAAAVIVHSQSMKQAAQERGAQRANLYLIPDPLPLNDAGFPESGMAACLPQSSPFDFRTECAVFFAPQLTATGNEKLPPAAMLVLDAFAVAARELGDCHLLLEAPESSRWSLQQHVARMGLARQVSFVEPDGGSAAWQAAHVVVAVGEVNCNPVAARRSNPICLKALRHGTALLAADVPRNRDASPEGRGCLWFELNNARDLSCRMVFLGANPDFRAALAATGRAHLLETRSHLAVGRKYAEAYHHAASRKKPKGTGPGLTAFYPAANCA